MNDIIRFVLTLTVFWIGCDAQKRNIFTDIEDDRKRQTLHPYPGVKYSPPEKLFVAHKTIPVTVSGKSIYLNVSSKTGKSSPDVDEFCLREVVKKELKMCKKSLKERVQNALLVMYIDHVNHLSDYLRSLGFDLEYTEGGSLYYLELMKLKQKLAISTKAKIIVESGFNLGHSALLFLFFNRNANVISFDLGEHEYIFPVAKYLEAHFFGRFELILGNSLESLPIFSDLRHDVYGKVDLFYIDGGHELNVAQSDLFWAVAYLNKRNQDARIIMDDLQLKSVRKAWARIVRSGILYSVDEVTDAASGCVSTDVQSSFVVARHAEECKRRSGYVVPNSAPVVFDMEDAVVGVGKVAAHTKLY